MQDRPEVAGSDNLSGDPDLDARGPDDEVLISWLSRAPHKSRSPEFTERVMKTIREREAGKGDQSDDEAPRNN